MSQPKAVPTPECDRLAEVSEHSQTIGDFLEWLPQQGIQLCSIPEEYDHTFVPIGRSIESLLAEFFEIDMAKVEKERRAVLDAFRAAQR